MHYTSTHFHYQMRLSLKAVNLEKFKKNKNEQQKKIHTRKLYKVRAKFKTRNHTKTWLHHHQLFFKYFLIFVFFFFFLIFYLFFLTDSFIPVSPPSTIIYHPFPCSMSQQEKDQLLQPLVDSSVADPELMELEPKPRRYAYFLFKVAIISSLASCLLLVLTISAHHVCSHHRSNSPSQGNNYDLHQLETIPVDFQKPPPHRFSNAIRILVSTLS